MEDNTVEEVKKIVVDYYTGEGKKIIDVETLDTRGATRKRFPMLRYKFDGGYNYMEIKLVKITEAVKSGGNWGKDWLNLDELLKDAGFELGGTSGIGKKEGGGKWKHKRKTLEYSHDCIYLNLKVAN